MLSWLQPGWRRTGGELAAGWQRVCGRLAALWRHVDGKLVAHWRHIGGRLVAGLRLVQVLKVHMGWLVVRTRSYIYTVHTCIRRGPPWGLGSLALEGWMGSVALSSCPGCKVLGSCWR